MKVASAEISGKLVVLYQQSNEDAQYSYEEDKYCKVLSLDGDVLVNDTNVT